MSVELLPQRMKTPGNREGAVLTVDGLKRDFGSREIVRSLTLELDPGMRAALSGPNGSGKTTVLRCIAGTLLPTEGRIQIAGRAPGTMAARHGVGVSMSQDRSFYLRISGRANLLFYARLRHGSSRQAARDVAAVVEELELGDIAAERADQCSTGMVQQLSLARALLGDPVLLLLDEPTRSLDKEARERLWAAIDRRTRLAVVIASHLEEDLERCGIRVNFPT
jgi:ABC-type multidrug transport system ATPase subunit